MSGGAALTRPTVHVGRIRRSRHPAFQAATPDGASLIRPTKPS
ncbi:hypothetical protein EAXG_04489 [Escherichia coli TA054]|nr:hypothetical protein EAXG_04489 [Escherichia coli TA054]